MACEIEFEECSSILSSMDDSGTPLSLDFFCCHSLINTSIPCSKSLRFDSLITSLCLIMIRLFFFTRWSKVSSGKLNTATSFFMLTLVFKPRI